MSQDQKDDEHNPVDSRHIPPSEMFSCAYRLFGKEAERSSLRISPPEPSRDCVIPWQRLPRPL